MGSVVCVYFERNEVQPKCILLFILRLLNCADCMSLGPHIICCMLEVLQVHVWYKNLFFSLLFRLQKNMRAEKCIFFRICARKRTVM